jgi:uncharacterized LabA/DUF88 family protein
MRFEGGLKFVRCLSHSDISATIGTRSRDHGNVQSAIFKLMTELEQQFYVKKASGAIEGPVPKSDLLHQIRAGAVVDADSVSLSGSGPWTTVGSLKRRPTQAATPCRTAVLWDLVGIIGESKRANAKTPVVRNPEESKFSILKAWKDLISLEDQARVGRLKLVSVHRAYFPWHLNLRGSRVLRAETRDIGAHPTEVGSKNHYFAKQSADVQIAVDAVDLCYQCPHIDLFVLIIGSQAQPALVQALRARGKEVLGYGPSSAAAVYAEFGASFIKMADDVR